MAFPAERVRYLEPQPDALIAAHFGHSGRMQACAKRLLMVADVLL